MASLRRVIDFSDGDVEAFVAYKQRLIDYINRFIADLANRGAEIAGLLDQFGAADVERLLAVVVRREAVDAVPEGEPGVDRSTAYDAAIETLLAAWRNRWRGLRDWFMSADARHPSQARLLRAAAVSAITQLIDTVAALNERRSGRSDRSADFRTLARWFADTPDDASAHQLWRVAFGLSAARHLTVPADSAAEWSELALPPNTPWAEAPPVRISPQLRRTGSYERRGQPNRIADRSAQRGLLAEQAAREAREVAAARFRLATDGPVLLSTLDKFDSGAFRLFLGLLGDALAARRPGAAFVETTTSDGTLLVRLSLVPNGPVVAIRTEDGVLRGPEHLIEIVDLAGGEDREVAVA
jgi:uncharacterized protein (TIGR02677 family)